MRYKSKLISHQARCMSLALFYRPTWTLLSKCNQCDYASSYKSTLRRHLKTHKVISPGRVHVFSIVQPGLCWTRCISPIFLLSNPLDQGACLPSTFSMHAPLHLPALHLPTYNSCLYYARIHYTYPDYICLHYLFLHFVCLHVYTCICTYRVVQALSLSR